MTRHSRHERQRPEVTVIGAGKFGHAIADIVSRHEVRTALVTRSATQVEQIRQRLARHSSYLSIQKFGDAHMNVVASTDPVGVEWAAIAKNVAMLGFHARLAASSSLNQAGVFTSDLFTEVYDYSLTMGADPRSFIGVAGVGDLMATSHASTSRNVRAGQLIGQGHSVGEAEARIKQVVESFHTVPLLEHRIHTEIATLDTLAISQLSQQISSKEP